jgi:Arc/MetJ-type ribon-helix-helix transcriptional regulator
MRGEVAGMARRNNRMPVVSVKMADALIEGLDELVRAGLYRSRSEAMRAAVRDLLRRELGDDLYKMIQNNMDRGDDGDGE